MAKVGRPSKYSQELIDTICERISDGEGLRSICRDKAMPSRQTVCTWLRTKPDFLDRYAQARELQADALFDEILEIADDGRNDWMEANDEDGTAKLNGEHIARSRLRVDARKWMAGKLRPKKYGDRQIIEGDKENPIIPDTADDNRQLARAILTIIHESQIKGKD